MSICPTGGTAAPCPLVPAPASSAYAHDMQLGKKFSDFEGHEIGFFFFIWIIVLCK